MTQPRNFELERRIKVEGIKNKLLENPKIVLDHFGIDYINKGNRLVSSCPCHSNSDNNTGFSLLLDGYPGKWQCFTRGCHEKYNSDILGLVHGILSNRSRKFVSFYDILKYCEENIGVNNIEVNSEYDFLNLSKKLEKRTEEIKVISNRSYVEKTLDIPSPYYIKKGFSEDILNRFSIGDCWNPQKQMFGRAVCPVFDTDKDSLIGSAGRLIEDKPYLAKWKFSWKLKTGSYFYGFWEALDYISQSKSVILVEGQMDVVKLHEFGYNQTIGCFGANITDSQIKLLNETGIYNITILMDGDDAGRNSSKRIESKCSNYFNTKVINLDDGIDPDNLSRQQIIDILGKPK